MAIIKNTAVTAYTESGVNLNVNASVDFNVVGESLLSVKTCSPLVGAVGTTVSYTITITNTNVLSSVTNVVVTDPLTSRLQFVAGSLKLGGNPISGDLATGVTIGTIPALGVRVLTYDCKVLSA